MSELVTRRDEQGVAYLSLNRPEQLNGLSMATLTQLRAHLNEIAHDEHLRVIVISASGKAFCAGHDLNELMAYSELPEYQALLKLCAGIMLDLKKMPQAVIARVQGVATAGGCQLVAACDLVVASQKARFAVSGINLGLFCSSPSVPMSRVMPTKALMEMLLTGDFIDAEKARELGLVNRVVDDTHLDETIAALCDSIKAKPAYAISVGKKMFYKQLEMGEAAAYQYANEVMAHNFLNSEAREGVDAFLSKRSPAWKT